MSQKVELKKYLHSNFTSKKKAMFFIKSVILYFLKISTTITM